MRPLYFKKHRKSQKIHRNQKYTVCVCAFTANFQMRSTSITTTPSKATPHYEATSQTYYVIEDVMTSWPGLTSLHAAPPTTHRKILRFRKKCEEKYWDFGKNTKIFRIFLDSLYRPKIYKMLPLLSPHIFQDFLPQFFS